MDLVWVLVVALAPLLVVLLVWALVRQERE